jgi:hypothetical protein
VSLDLLLRLVRPVLSGVPDHELTIVSDRGKHPLGLVVPGDVLDDGGVPSVGVDGVEAVVGFGVVVDIPV